MWLTMTKMSRYSVRPIVDAFCGSLKLDDDDEVFQSDSLDEAKEAAAMHSHEAPFGMGIFDRKTGEIDVGFGFAVAAPDPDDDA